MKLLRITAQGLPLFKEPLDIVFYAQQRVNDGDIDSLYRLGSNLYLQPTTAFIGVNASGKTSVLKVISLVLRLLKSNPINHIAEKTILGQTDKATLNIYFCDNQNKVCRLETVITAKYTKYEGIWYTIASERLWEKPLKNVRTKKYLTDFTGIEPSIVREKDGTFISDDVSLIIGRNRETGDIPNMYSLLSMTNINILPIINDVPIEIITFLDPSIEKLYFENSDIHLKFKDSEEIIVSKAIELEQYLSSGTIKGITAFSMAREVFISGGYLVIDEIENHFNKEIVATLIRLFLDSRFNKYGSSLIFSTHYPELLDEYDRNDSIYITSKGDGIIVENLSNLLKRNDIKKSDAYQSGFLKGTTPSYNSYMAMKKNFTEAMK